MHRTIPSRSLIPTAVETALTVDGTSQIVRRLNYLGRQGLGAWKRRNTVAAFRLMGLFLLATAGFQFSIASEPESDADPASGEVGAERVKRGKDAVAAGLVEIQHDFSETAGLVARLFKDGDTDAFARDITPSIENWRSVRSITEKPNGEDTLGESFERHLKNQRERLARAARRLLQTAEETGFDPAELEFSRIVEPVWYNAMRRGNLMEEDHLIPSVRSLRLVFLRDADPVDAGQEFEVVLYELTEFPNGWRCSGGLFWSRMPEGMMTEEMQRKFNLIDHAQELETVDASEDPLLARLGEDVLAFLQNRSAPSREGLFWSWEEAWSQMKESIQNREAAGEDAPTEADAREHFDEWSEMIFQSLDATADRLEGIGVDFTHFEPHIENVEADLTRSPGRDLDLEGLSANSIRITFSLPPGSEFAGRPIEGTYIFAARDATRTTNRWILESEVRWERIPEHLLDEGDKQSIEFENYVAEHGGLPPGTTAPDIQLVSIDDPEARVRLSDFRGKVVVLEFWASWCGPCQEPMAQLQELVEKNPEWGEDVAVITVSLDDESETAGEHLQSRGWDRTLNLWAGPGGFRSDAAREYRVSGIPRNAVIDPEGVIRQGGRSGTAIIARTVAELLAE